MNLALKNLSRDLRDLRFIGAVKVQLDSGLFAIGSAPQKFKYKYLLSINVC